MKIKLFATLKEKAGASSIEIEIDEAMTVKALHGVIVQTYPALEQNLRVSIASVNRQYADLETMVHPADEVAFFPPVSGG